MLSESVEPNLTTSAPSFSPTRYFGRPSLNTRPLSNLEPGTAKNGVLSRLFSFFRLYETPKNGASILPNAE
jgi:hypothetical protein